MSAGLGLILVVDDDANNRELLSRRLQRTGYEAVASRDGRHALTLITERLFDVVLLDVMMPGLDGFEVLEILRRDRSLTDLPVIMATAKDNSDDIVRALGLGANDYITKPIDYPVVVARIATQIALKRAVDQVRQLKRSLADRNRDLEAVNARVSRDLRAAARIQESLLPQTAPDVSGLSFSWAFRPCDELAGDGLNAIKLNDELAAFYVLDVSGHGVASSLLSVSLGRLLSPPSDPSSILVRGGEGADRLDPISPSEVAGRLNRLFPFEVTTEQYSTLVYGILDTARGEFRYTLAGHPAPILLDAAGVARVLPGRGFPIGLADGKQAFGEWVEPVEPGDRIFLFSDGIPEAAGPGGGSFGMDRLLARIETGRPEPLCSIVNELVGEIEGWSGASGVRDDVSIVAVEFRGRGPASLLPVIPAGEA